MLSGLPGSVRLLQVYLQFGRDVLLMSGTLLLIYALLAAMRGNNAA